MKNKIKKIIIILNFLIIISFNVSSSEQFNFDVTEVEILDNGKKFRGVKRGTITSENGIIINADKFVYYKITNILNAEGNVEILDNINDYKIYSDDVTYFKNEEKFITKSNSKAINKELILTADEFEYNKNLNIIKATNNVEFKDKIKNIILRGEDVTYEKNIEKISTVGLTDAKIDEKYNFYSKNVNLDRNMMELSSKNETQIKDNKFNLYKVREFKYFVNDELLKGNDVEIITNTNLPIKLSDKFFFSSGFFDLKNNNFNATETKVEMKKNIFGNINNDPRLIGVSSFKKNEITQVNKGIFTSCKKTDNCPPWSIKAEKIKHNKLRKQLIYDNAILQIYDVPVVYFPKFFHPDPTVKRQTGILKPILNQSNILGSSLKIPYYKVLSEDKDLTISPNIFEKDIFMVENEFRQKSRNSTLLANYGFTRGYKSSVNSKKKNISHLFAKYKLDLGLENYNSSILDLNFEKVNNDTYLKVFDSNLTETLIKPQNKDKLTSSLDFSLEHQNFNLSSGFTSYESLSGKNSDRYQYVLPYYNFSRNLFENQDILRVNLYSSGSNNLQNTNNLKSRVINDLSFESLDYFTEFGIKNNFQFLTKNLNTVAKNDNIYKSTPQIELMSIFETRSTLPLIKSGSNSNNYLEPKISFRFNPGNMKNYSDSNRKIDVSNIFNINRLGLTDSFEEGKSLTVGLDYKKEDLDNINKYFEFKIASVFRDDTTSKIPLSSAIKESGNLIGSIKNNINENFNFTYDFSIDNDLKTFDYNSLSANLNLNKFSTGINFIEENNKIGDSNIIENFMEYKFDESNYLTFNTRRNRKIDLTEFYNLVYEYKNDCLIAGIKYKKTYYQDRDLLPTEDFIISITIFPLTTYERNFDR
ncbi:LPS-assembly protein LptD [Pelagibacterales bacterium SAG-MED22]|nr:LPS-assembly protein LptD [Pelagibacterales bacterium SAG-MED22]